MKRQQMNLKEFIEWHKTIDVYELSPKIADKKSWGFMGMGNLELPDIKDLYDKAEDEVWRGERMEYLAIYDDVITKWAEKTWPFLRCVQAKIQIQQPGEGVRPHLDLCGTYLESVVKEIPWMAKRRHSIDEPGVDIYRMVVAMEDHVEGQQFVFGNQEWTWKKGDCVRINALQSLHWTKNNSKVNRPMIKITAIDPRNK